jgi:hypothetical protein
MRRSPLAWSTRAEEMRIMTKMSWHVILGLVVIGAVVYGADTRAQQPDWQKHASWCKTDGGSSGGKYHGALSQGRDQYDAVIVCQQDSGNGGAVAAVQSAGREAVNSFMGGGPATATPQPAPAQVYVVGRYDCRYADGTTAGDVSFTTWADSCTAAYQEQARYLQAQGGDACTAVDRSKQTVGNPKWIQAGACQTSGRIHQ